MRRQEFVDNWICFPAQEERAAKAVSLPHDAMLLDKKSTEGSGGETNGWIDAGDYCYKKDFFVPIEWKAMCPVFEFEGVYHKARVFLNGSPAAFHRYGYTGFFVNGEELLKYGEMNEIRVEAVNSDQPNCRWYSGTGIYRPVWLHLLPKDHICLEGLKITTLDYRKREIRVEGKTTGHGSVIVEILDGTAVLQREELMSSKIFQCDISLRSASCWDSDNPKLYTCRVTYKEDMAEETFGIRQIQWSREEGFCINGKRVILRGACIHHDNGILGACAYEFAERRKIRILKESGYNAVRSAHNPCSKALLKACDELGMLVADEYVDSWFIHKTKYDYAGEVENNYREDLQSMVEKDYNHPSVIMYSTGNEVSETAKKKGIQLCRDMTDYLHRLDGTRPVTCGINIFFNFLSTAGFGVYSDKKAEKNNTEKSRKAVGSEFFNKLAGIMGAGFMKTGATLYPCDVLTRDAFAAMDIAGYNYGIKRYRHDLRKYQERLILGSETFCADAYGFWELAKENKRLAGDFVWSGMDYLGEVGIGSQEYEEYAPQFSHGLGWVSAGSGRIDLTGKPLAEMKYTRVAFELEPIGIGVVPVPNASKKHSPSAWKMTNAIESWSWHGCEGMKTKVEVYARAHHISLFINGTCVGTKKPVGDCRVVFTAVYHDGELMARAYDERNCLLAETSLHTAEEKTYLTLCPEDKIVNRKEGLCYVRLKYTDEHGVIKPMERGKITVIVEGGTLLGLGSACPYYTGSYLDNTCDTYYGEALAVIKPGDGAWVAVTASDRDKSATARIEVN